MVVAVVLLSDLVKAGVKGCLPQVVVSLAAHLFQ